MRCITIEIGINERTRYAFVIALCILAYPPTFASGRRLMVTEETPVASLFKQDGTTYVIQGRVDLHGHTCSFAENCTVSLKNGSLVNGRLIGAATRVKHIKSGSLGVVLQGSWVLERFSDSIFDATLLSDDQIIANINALQSDDVDNRIILKKASYSCSIPKNDGCLLRLTSNTSLELRTRITIKGNDFTSYNIIRIRGKKNVSIAGGQIEGDVGRHTYVSNSTSQWGHGINIYNSKNITIKNVVITRCIGDGIAISGGKSERIGDYGLASSNVRVKGVRCRYNRRQGISIIYAEGVSIDDCELSNTGTIEYQSPSAGIDIEPNTSSPYHQAVRNVSVTNCTFFGNVGYSILSNHYENHDGIASVRNVVFSKCKCDARVFLYTGGINFEDTEMKELSLFAQRDPIVGISFKRCKIVGGNGIQLYCPSNGKDCSIKIGDISFERCVIAVKEGIDDEQKGLVWCRGRSDRMRNVSFKRCSLHIPKEVSHQFELVSSNSHEIILDKCQVSIPGRMFPLDRVHYNKCKITADNIHEQ